MRVDNPGPRTLLGPALVDRQSDPKEHTSTITTRKFDVAHYELTGEIRYLEEGETMEMPSVIANAKVMKSEITTIEQFEAVGNNRDVANKYGVGLSAAHGLRMSLLAKAKREVNESEEGIQGPSAEEVEQFFTDVEQPQGFPEMEVSEVEMNPSETYHVPPTNEEPQGMTEEENMTDEEWEAQYVKALHEEENITNKELEAHVSEVEKQWEGHSEDELTEAAIRMCWDNIKDYLGDIRRIEIERVDKQIKAKLQGMMEGMNAC